MQNVSAMAILHKCMKSGNLFQLCPSKTATTKQQKKTDSKRARPGGKNKSFRRDAEAGRNVKSQQITLCERSRREKAQAERRAQVEANVHD